jgi:hypothetical protein
VIAFMALLDVPEALIEATYTRDRERAGWIERSETHQVRHGRRIMCFAALNLSYATAARLPPQGGEKAAVILSMWSRAPMEGRVLGPHTSYYTY